MPASALHGHGRGPARARKRDPGVGAPVGQVGHVCLAAVGAGDRLHDRESESGAGACVVAAAEALEGAAEREQAVGESSVALVEHVQLDLTVALLCDQGDGAAAVAERVVDQVAERLLDPTWIGDDGELVVGADEDLAAVD